MYIKRSANSMSTKLFINNQKVFNDFYKNKKNCEDETLDYKIQFHFSSHREKLELIKDIVSFANTGGGAIIYGVSDKEYEWEGLDDSSDDIDDIQIRSQLEKYVDKPIAFQCGTYKINGAPFYMITIERSDELVAFTKVGEYDKKHKGSNKSHKVPVFKAGDIYGRVGSSCKEISNDLFFLERRTKPVLTNLFTIEAPYRKYVERKQLEETLIEYLKNYNVRHVRINGLGGIGKTSFVRHLCERIYNKEINLGFNIEALIWITGKLNLFNPNGEILTIRNSNLTYREMLEQFADVLMIDSEDIQDDVLCSMIMEKLSEHPSIVVFDNMETIDDEKIHEFYKNVPAICHVIFTSRTDLTTYYTRIDISGFDKEQFFEYVKNSIEEYRPDKVDEILDEVSSSIDELRQLTGGSPILINFIMCKICSGNDVAGVLAKLKELEKKKKDINGFYNSVMDFCFNDAFKTTTLLEKRVLFAMSIPVDEEAFFDLSDLSYILDIDEYEVDEALKSIYSISFCSKRMNKYTCPLLIRAFVDKKVSEAYSKVVDRDAIAAKYYQWLKNKEDFEFKNESYYDKIKAYDFKRKLAASKVSELKNRYYNPSLFDDIVGSFDSIINEMPNYGYLYFEKAKFLRNYDELNTNDICDLYKKAIECEPTSDYYLSEFAFYLSKNRRNSEAVEYFKKALEYNPDAPNINHGMAKCLAALFDSKEDRSDNADFIIRFFEKGYVKDTASIGNRIRYCGNAHSHASFLSKLKKYNEALDICSRGLALMPNDKKLLALQGTIMTSIDPDWISDTKVRKTKKGLFASIDDEKMKEIIRLVEEEDKG